MPVVQLSAQVCNVSSVRDNWWDSFHVVECTPNANVCFVPLPPQDKRRIQENIAIKRRQIEEEKLKLQYIKVLVYFNNRNKNKRKCAGW